MDRARLALASVLVVALSLPAATSSAAESDAGSLSWAGTAVAPKDVYESDDGPAEARDLLAPDVWAAMGRFGIGPIEQDRTFDEVSAADPDSCDEDWVRVAVDADAVRAGMSLLVEAVSDDRSVDPVIEVYGPMLEGELPSYTPPSSLPLLDDGSVGGDRLALASFDDDPWFSGRQASASIVLDPRGSSGVYYIRIRPYFAGSGSGVGGAGPYRLRVKAGLAARLAGTDRYRTAVRISQERNAAGALAGGSALVASGEEFADALAGSSLAGAVDGPLLLAAPERLPSAVSKELRRLGVTTVYVLGSEAAVAPAVAREIDSLPGVSVVRLGGRDRYETAVLVAEETQRVLRRQGRVSAPIAFVSSGVSFPDALAASPVAAYGGAPVLLTPPDELATVTLRALERLQVRDVILVGGTAAVSSSVERKLVARLGASHVQRLAGEDRYSTARAVAAWAVAGGSDGRIGTRGSPAALPALQPFSVGLASGAAFPDALAGGVLCGIRGAPILLTRPGSLSRTVSGYADSLGTPLFFKSYVFGGPPAVSQKAMDHFELLTTAWWGEG